MMKEHILEHYNRSWCSRSAIWRLTVGKTRRNKYENERGAINLFKRPVLDSFYWWCFPKSKYLQTSENNIVHSEFKSKLREFIETNIIPVYVNLPNVSDNQHCKNIQNISNWATSQYSSLFIKINLELEFARNC